MKKFGVILCTGFFMLLSVTGCSEVPESKEQDGIEYAVGNVEKDINEIVKSDEQESGFFTETEEGYRCKASLGQGTDILNINALVTNRVDTKCKILNAVPSDTAFEKEDILKAFFSEGEQVQELDDIQAYDAENAYDSEGIVSERKTSIEHAVHITNQSNTIDFIRASDSSLFYFNNDLNTKYKEISSGEEEYWYNTEKEVAYTIEDAWEEVESVLSGIGVEGLQMQYYTGCKNGEEIYYSIDFFIRVDGIPIANEIANGDEEIPDAYGSVTVGTSGISELNLDNMLWDVVESEDTNIITQEQLMQVLEKYVDSGDIICSSQVVFENVELMYMLKTDDWENFTLYPVWRVYIPLTKWVTDEELEEILSEQGDISHDIIIDAVTGELLQVN